LGGISQKKIRGNDKGNRFSRFALRASLQPSAERYGPSALALYGTRKRVPFRMARCPFAWPELLNFGEEARGPSTAPFAKNADGFALNDKFGREARRKPAMAKATATAVAEMLFGWRSGFLRSAARKSASGFGRNDDSSGL
jgi:hypothetical protein